MDRFVSLLLIVLAPSSGCGRAEASSWGAVSPSAPPSDGVSAAAFLHQAAEECAALAAREDS